MTTYIFARVCGTLLGLVIERLEKTIMDKGCCGQHERHYQIHPNPPMFYGDLSYLDIQFGI
jgi:hypothetical protein